MRVLFLNHNVVGSGTFLRAFHFAREMAARGHEITLVTTSRTARWRGRTYQREGIELFEAPDLLSGRGRTGWDVYNTLVRRRFVLGRSYDVVHAFDSRPAVIFPALHAIARRPATFVMDWADWWGRGGWISERSGWLVSHTFGPVETWFEEAFRTRAHGHTVASRALAERSIGLGVAPERVEVLPGGCDMPQTETQSRARARGALGLGNDRRVVLHVGVLTPGDYAFLRGAFAQVRAEQPAALLVLAGRTGMRVPRCDGVITGELETGMMRKWLAAADVCVVPCRDTVGNRGRWPSKVNDYMSAGRAIVMPRVSDAAVAIERAGAGWITDATREGFAQGILTALADRTAADAAGERGKSAARGELSWPRLTDRLTEFYVRMAARL